MSGFKFSKGIPVIEDEHPIEFKYEKYRSGIDSMQLNLLKSCLNFKFLLAYANWELIFVTRMLILVKSTEQRPWVHPELNLLAEITMEIQISRAH